MKPISYLNAASLEQASAALKRYGSKARAIAGGTDLLGEIKDGILPLQPEVIVNLKKIPGLDSIRKSGRSLKIGAMTRLEDIARHEVVRRDWSILAEAAAGAASPHIREMGTIAGNICQNNRCWYYRLPDNRFYCLRKGGSECYALSGDARYHSILGSNRLVPAPCAGACPAGIDIPDYLRLLREDELPDAVELFLRRNPLPAITGRVCPHFCEGECSRRSWDAAVSTREIERFLGDYALANSSRFYAAPADLRDCEVAIVGSGPAGLSAAFYLRKAGYRVTVFEKRAEAGGLLFYGIPDYRLPREVVRRQVNALAGMGIEFKTNYAVDRKGLQKLCQHFGAVFLASGAWQEKPVGIEGERFLRSGMEFLEHSSARGASAPGRRVGVVGGGNVAMDVARSLLRLGAEPLVIYRRTRSEMPALAEEVEKAEQEGVKFAFLTQPVRAVRQKPGLSLSCLRMELKGLDGNGRPRPVPLKGSGFTLQLDALIKAIGEEPDYSLLLSRYLDGEGKLKVGKEGFRLGGNLFAGGDFLSGPATVVQAVAAGRQAAEAVNAYLGAGTEPGPSGRRYSCFHTGEKFGDLSFKKIARLEGTAAGLADIRIEAHRCFNCGCIAVNCSDLAPALVVLGATLKTTQRKLKLEQFFGFARDSMTVLDRGELIAEIRVPRPPRESGAGFAKFALRKSIDFPLVNCAVLITFQQGKVADARICLNSIYNLPFRPLAAERSLLGKSLTEKNAEAAARAFARQAFPAMNNRYKIQIARTLLKRTLLACKSKV
jgi:NADPH-dependent glutamate synthase beta subunit-like oxidoreductase